MIRIEYDEHFLEYEEEDVGGEHEGAKRRPPVLFRMSRQRAARGMTNDDGTHIGSLEPLVVDLHSLESWREGRGVARSGSVGACQAFELRVPTARLRTPTFPSTPVVQTSTSLSSSPFLLPPSMSPYSKWKPWVAVSAVADSFNPGTPTGIPATQEPHGQNWSTDRSTSNPVPSRSKDHEAFLLLGIRDAPAAGVQAENAIKVHLRKAGLLWSDWRRPESSELGLELAIGFQRAIAWAVENEKSEVFVDFAEITFGAPNAALHAAYVTSGWGPTTTVGWRPFIPDLVRIQRAPFRYETARAAGRVRPQAAGGVRWRFEVIEVKWTSNLNVVSPKSSDSYCAARCTRYLIGAENFRRTGATRGQDPGRDLHLLHHIPPRQIQPPFQM